MYCVLVCNNIVCIIRYGKDTSWPSHSQIQGPLPAAGTKGGLKVD